MNQALQRFRKGGAVALKHERELLHRVTVVGLGKTAGIFLFRFFYARGCCPGSGLYDYIGFFY